MKEEVVMKIQMRRLDFSDELNGDHLIHSTIN